MQKIIIRYGLLSGATIVLLILITTLIGYKNIGFENGQLVGYSSMVLSFLFVFYGIKSYRSKLPEEKISFGRAFKVGILIALTGCLCYVIGWLIISNTIYTNFIEEYTQYYLEKKKAEGLTANEMSKVMEEINSNIKMLENPLVNFAVTFMEIFPVGLIMTLISSWILKKK